MIGEGSPGTGGEGQTPFVSVIIPCRNERLHIGGCLDSIVASSYPKDRLEVIVADGMSDDGTREIIREYGVRHGFIRLLDNTKQVTPAALNEGIRSARGDVIVRMDAHAAYPPDYLSKLVHWLEESGADNVGGVCETVPGRDTPEARAVATALSDPFGVGNSYFRIGASEPRWVDTVPFGCYRREVFDTIGLFDEELVRNQDDELNHRLIRAGGRILLVPEIVSTYFARDTVRQLARMYFQYGYFKPAVIRKLGGVYTIRQLVPGGLVAVLALSALLAPFSAIAVAALIAVLTAYTMAVLGTALTADLDWRARAHLCLAFPAMHFGYGLGFLKGLANVWPARRKAAERGQSTPLSR